jgi:hypothetical protein
MAISRDMVGGIAIAAAVVGFICYQAWNNTDKTSYPDQQIGLTGFNAEVDSCTAEEFFRPHNVVANQGVAYTRHRYPTVTGGNISSLIHHGLDQLRQPAPADDKWITRPPENAMW